ncbi:MAG TPA: Crp/Fnr family transcriptional regulator [Candidatus Sulfotelmatobacter sp.]|jgi:CRP-like cAMP-binding protein|nr:Crp/Fnr family transcriptional regulator [Candidatus Sulfotelmatobacter sp.]
MAKTQAGFAGRFVPKPSSRGVDPRSIRNEILLSLPPQECAAVLSELEFVEMRSYDLLNEMGEPIENCYFMNSGMTSILTIMGDGKGVEVGLTGKEGFIGLPVIVGLKTSATRAIVQISGSAYRLSAPQITQALEKCPQLTRRLNRYSQELGMQATQVAACNRLHDVERRLARWLLMSQDRVGGDIMPLTQEFLSHMLGTRRASVTVAAGILQRAGLIKYSRGAVTIMNRAKLEDAACECYAIISRQSQNWLVEGQA